MGVISNFLQNLIDGNPFGVPGTNDQLPGHHEAFPVTALKIPSMDHHHESMGHEHHHQYSAFLSSAAGSHANNDYLEDHNQAHADFLILQSNNASPSVRKHATSFDQGGAGGGQQNGSDHDNGSHHENGDT